MFANTTNESWVLAERVASELKSIRARTPGIRIFYAPMDKTFSTIAGSYLEEGMPIYLIIEPEHLDEAVRDLIRIGYDTVVGYATPETLAEAGNSVPLASTGVTDFAGAAAIGDEDGALYVDVRRQTEFDAGHLPDAVNIAHTRLLARADEIESGRQLLVYCRTGARAAAASALLERLGHNVVYVDDEISKVVPEPESDLVTA